MELGDDHPDEVCLCMCPRSSYDLDETYKDFVKILLTVHKRVYDMKHKMDIWVFQEEKNMKNISTKNTKVSA